MDDIFSILAVDSFTFIPDPPPQTLTKRQAPNPIRSWRRILQHYVGYLCFEYNFLCYPLIYDRIHMITDNHNVSCIKLSNDIEFFAQLPVSNPYIRYQYAERLYFSK